MKDANIAADQKLNYLRSYISGVPLQLGELQEEAGHSYRTLDRIRNTFW